jgi:geranylgeranyl pyrophosphate synthase
MALQQIIQFVDTYNGMEYANRVCRQHTDKADELINRLPPSVWRDYLLQISDTL